MGIPSPQERPHLYDGDFPDRPEGWVNPVNVDYPEHIREAVAATKRSREKRLGLAIVAE